MATDTSIGDKRNGNKKWGLMDPCVTVTGVVVQTDEWLPFSGGDYDAAFEIRPVGGNPYYRRMVAYSAQAGIGDLIHCEIPQPFWSKDSSLQVKPTVGDVISVSGAWVLDFDEGGFSEIHPAYRWTSRTTRTVHGALSPSISTAAMPPATPIVFEILYPLTSTSQKFWVRNTTNASVTCHIVGQTPDLRTYIGMNSIIVPPAPEGKTLAILVSASIPFPPSYRPSNSDSFWCGDGTNRISNAVNPTIY